MIRNSRGIQIRRNVLRVYQQQIGHHSTGINHTVTAPRARMSCLKDIQQACCKGPSPFHLPNLDSLTLLNSRLYNTSRPSIHSSGSAAKNNDIQMTSSNSNDAVVAEHDYIQAPDSGPIISSMSDKEIHDYLTDRLRCIANRETQQLRDIDEVFENANVFVDDIAKQWRADGNRFAVYLRKNDTTDTTTQNGTVDPRDDYFRSPYSGPSMIFIPEAEIHTLLAERHYCRRIRDYDNSDRIRKKLESYGVFIDDKKQKWRGDGTKISLQTHNYTMSRDSGPIKSHASEVEIHNMLNKRHRCRLRKDYKGADRIYEKLKNCGVSIDDEILEWRADGITFSKFLRRHEYKLASDAGPSIAKASESDIHKLMAMHWSYKNSGDTKKADAIWQDLSDIGVFLDVASMEWRADGLKHNYRKSSDAGQNISRLHDTVIHALLEKRMLFRWRKDFASADGLRDKLKAEGVLLDDINKEWRADGKRYHHLCHQYRQAPGSGPLLSTLSENAIHAILSKVWQMKLSRDFDTANTLADELFQAGVYFNDEKELWRADGKTCNYTLIPGAGPINNSVPIDEVQIHGMLEESFRLRLRQNFPSANRIHDQLFNAGIFLDLNNNLYRGDGIMHNYSISPVSGPSNSLMLEDDINKLLAERWQCKIAQDFANADRIFVELYDNGVFVDDETMEWRADGIYHTYRLTPDAGTITSTLPVDEIHALIGRRIRHKKFMDFVKADQILRYLKGARVQLDDKKKEWRGDGVVYKTSASDKRATRVRYKRS